MRFSFGLLVMLGLLAAKPTAAFVRVSGEPASSIQSSRCDIDPEHSAYISLVVEINPQQIALI